MIIVLTGRAHGENRRILKQLFGLRYEVFIRGGGWVAPARAGTDRYDDRDAVYFVDLDAENQIQAGVRITPTDKSSLISDYFPQLMEMEETKRHSKIYELNRHVLAPSVDYFQGRVSVARLLVAIVEWSLQQQITHLQAMIDDAAAEDYLTISPLLRQLGAPVGYGGGRGTPGGGELIGIRWPVNPSLLEEVRKYCRVTEAQAVLAADDILQNARPKN